MERDPFSAKNQKL